MKESILDSKKSSMNNYFKMNISLGEQNFFSSTWNFPTKA